MAVSPPDFPAFDVEREPMLLSQRWKKWVGQFESIIIALDIKQSKRKKALLLHYAGLAVQEIADATPCCAWRWLTRRVRRDPCTTEWVLQSKEKCRIWDIHVPPSQTAWRGNAWPVPNLVMPAVPDLWIWIPGKWRARLYKVACQRDSQARPARLQDTLSDLTMYRRSLETSELQATGMEKTSTPASEVNQLTSRPPKTTSTQTSETPHVGIVVAHIHTREVENLAQLMANTVATVEEQITFPPTLPLQE